MDGALSLMEPLEGFANLLPTTYYDLLFYGRTLPRSAQLLNTSPANGLPFECTGVYSIASRLSGRKKVARRT